MGWTYEQAKRYAPDYAHLHPHAPGNPCAGPKETAPPPRGGRPRITSRNALGQNKTEAAYDRHLADLTTRGMIDVYHFESIKLRLAGRTYLTVDFVVRYPCLDHEHFDFVDVKGGPLEDDAAVKLKVASEKYQWLGQFWIVRKAGPTWEYQTVDPLGGIGARGTDQPDWDTNE